MDLSREIMFIVIAQGIVCIFRIVLGNKGSKVDVAWSTSSV